MNLGIDGVSNSPRSSSSAYAQRKREVLHATTGCCTERARTGESTKIFCTVGRHAGELDAESSHAEVTEYRIPEKRFGFIENVEDE